MLILLTNDDGVHSEGLLVLKEYLSKGHTVYVVAPEKERTCVAHGITLHKPLRLKEVGGHIFSSNGTPADCVLLGLKILLPEKPDFVISGINRGPNMGQDVHYSGTVAAAEEAALSNIPSLAISIDGRKDFHFHDASLIVGELIEMLKNRPFPYHTFLNVNIPNIQKDKINGFMVTRLGKRVYNDTVLERMDPRGYKYYWIAGGGDDFEMVEGTDFYAVKRGFVSISPLELDMTNSESMEYFKKCLMRRGGVHEQNHIINH
ncbi:MAG: 5'/3'-nucleotidase SurE [Syntrophorhabdaceae bacterium]|nr:5'/3'-nucleotidase SurE [Syntrophorhabdaceae bacterium]